MKAILNLLLQVSNEKLSIIHIIVFLLFLEDTSDKQYKPISEIKVDEESSMTLEDQLRAVQKQLQALSQLPSVVQMTLDAVSKQLADIVGPQEENTSENEEMNPEELEKMEEGTRKRILKEDYLCCD